MMTTSGSPENTLNNLSSKEWVYFTSTIWQTDYCHDPTWELRKRLKTTKPPYVMRDIIKFFTKRGERILDIFAGVGSTLLGAELCGREAVGIELYPEWCKIYEEIKSKFYICDGEFIEAPSELGRKIKSRIINGDCLERVRTFKDEYVDAVICDPPHGIDHGHIRKIKSRDSGDFGIVQNYEDFFKKMIELGKEIHRVLRNGRYWVIMMGDRYRENEFIPLGALLGDKLRNVGFQLKGIKTWWNRFNMKILRPYGVNQDFVPNIVHNNIVILKKIGD